MTSARPQRVGRGSRREWLLAAGTCLVASYLLAFLPLASFVDPILLYDWFRILGPMWVLGNLVLVAPFILLWPLVSRALPALERSAAGVLASYLIAQLFHLPLVVAAFLVLAPWVTGPHDFGLGAVAYTFPMLFGCLFGFLLPRALFANLRPGAFLREAPASARPPVLAPGSARVLRVGFLLPLLLLPRVLFASGSLGEGEGLAVPRALLDPLWLHALWALPGWLWSRGRRVQELRRAALAYPLLLGVTYGSLWTVVWGMFPPIATIDVSIAAYQTAALGLGWALAVLGASWLAARPLGRTSGLSRPRTSR
jgi:hypothetical protein